MVRSGGIRGCPLRTATSGIDQSHPSPLPEIGNTLPKGSPDQRDARPVVSENLNIGSTCEFVLVDEPTQPVMPTNLAVVPMYRPE